MKKNIIALFIVAVAILSTAFVYMSERPKGKRMEPKLAIEWNKLGYEIAYAEDEFLTFKGQRALSMMHLAIHDAQFY